MSTALAIPTRELENRILELQRAGRDYASIASELNLTPKRVATIVRRVYARHEAAGEMHVDVQRKTVLGRIDEMISALYLQAIGKEPRIVTTSTGEEIAVKLPSIEAIKAIQSLDKSRRELLGLDLTQKKESNGPVNVVVSYVDNGGPATTPRPTMTPVIDVQYEEPKQLEGARSDAA